MLTEAHADALRLVLRDMIVTADPPDELLVVCFQLVELVTEKPTLTQLRETLETAQHAYLLACGWTRGQPASRGQSWICKTRTGDTTWIQPSEPVWADGRKTEYGTEAAIGAQDDLDQDPIKAAQKTLADRAARIATQRAQDAAPDSDPDSDVPCTRCREWAPGNPCDRCGGPGTGVDMRPSHLRT